MKKMIILWIWAFPLWTWFIISCQKKEIENTRSLNSEPLIRSYASLIDSLVQNTSLSSPTENFILQDDLHDISVQGKIEYGYATGWWKIKKDSEQLHVEYIHHIGMRKEWINQKKYFLNDLLVKNASYFLVTQYVFPSERQSKPYLLIEVNIPLVGKERKTIAVFHYSHNHVTDTLLATYNTSVPVLSIPKSKGSTWVKGEIYDFQKMEETWIYRKIYFCEPI